MIEDVVRSEHAGLDEFRTQLCEVADELGQDAHVEAARDLPPAEIELAEETDSNQALARVPVAGKPLEIPWQMLRRSLLIHCGADHVQRADSAVVQRVKRRVGVLGATRRMAGGGG